MRKKLSLRGQLKIYKALAAKAESYANEVYQLRKRIEEVKKETEEAYKKVEEERVKRENLLRQLLNWTFVKQIEVKFGDGTMRSEFIGPLYNDPAGFMQDGRRF